MSMLVHAEVDGDRLDDDSLVHESLLILIGGDETTRHVITGGAFQLLTDRDQWDAAGGPTRDTLATAVEEMLRWVSPIKNMARTATRDVELSGQQIEEGQKLLLLYSSANRDEDVFADPFTLRQHRARRTTTWPSASAPTSASATASPASSSRVMFDRLLERLPDLELAEPTEPVLPPRQLRQRLRVDAGAASPPSRQIADLAAVRRALSPLPARADFGLGGLLGPGVVGLAGR